MARAARRAALGLAALGLLASCGQGAPTDAFELSGVVTVLLQTGDDGGPIAGAHVTFSSDTLIVSETDTDDEGRYRMRVMTDYDFGQVRVTAEGFRPSERTVFFDVPQRRVDVQMRRAVGD